MFARYHASNANVYHIHSRLDSAQGRISQLSSFTECLCSHEEVHQRIVTALNAAANIDHHWKHVLDVAYVHDLDDLGLGVVRASLTWSPDYKIIEKMEDGNSLQTVIKVIQALIDANCQTRLRLEYFLKKIVRDEKRIVVPGYLYRAEIANMESMEDQSSGGYAGVKRWQDAHGRAFALKILREFERAGGHGVQNKALQVSLNLPLQSRMLTLFVQAFVREVMIWRQFNHVNVVPFLGIAYSPSCLAFVSPWMQNGSLGNFLNHNANIATDLRKDLIRGIARGLYYLHYVIEPPVLHGDLSAGNVVLDERYSPRITDFGHTKVIDSQVVSVPWSSSFKLATLNYRAPELWNKAGFPSAGILTNKCDVYSFGCLCFQIFASEPPFAKLDDRMVYQAIMSGKNPMTSDLRERAKQCGMDENLYSLMRKCQRLSANDRPDMTKVKEKLRITDRDPVPSRLLPDLHVFESRVIHGEHRVQVLYIA